MKRIRASGLTGSRLFPKSAVRQRAGAISGVALACMGSFLCVGSFFSMPAIAQSNRLPNRSPDRSSDRFVDVRNPNQVPTARYGRGEDVDLSLIVEEWRDRFPATAVFVCSCRSQACGNKSVWPFREFTLYQPFVALGDTNAADNEATGFRCFDIETGRSPRRG